jgi:hypothetical protein
VDGCADAECISQLFADKYRELYTCVGFDKEDMSKIMQTVNMQIDNMTYSSDCIIHV